jgi:hypothetical protein
METKLKFGKPLFCPACGQVLPLNTNQVNGRKGGLKSHGGLVTKAKYGDNYREHYAALGARGGRPRNDAI